MKPTYVHSIGPEPEINRYGDEYPIWIVGLMTDDDECLKSYTCHSFEKAYALGEKIARDRRIDHVAECGRA